MVEICCVSLPCLNILGFFFGVLSEQKEQFEDGKLVGVYFYTIAFHISDNANKYLVRRII